MSLAEAIIVFIVSTIVIGVAGTFLTKQADRLADLTGMGEALMGGLFLGAVTSLSGIVTSVTAAWENHPELSVSNAVGGIAAQTVFLAIADITYKKANLEHASASFTNLMQAVLLIFLLAFIFSVSFLNEFHIFGVHPASIILIIFYVYGQKLITKAKEKPMWNPVDTKDTEPDVPDEKTLQSQKTSVVAMKFTAFAIIIGLAGYTVTQSAIVIADNTPLSDSIVGALFTSIATSLPELVVAVSAVRQGALTLAVGNIIGGNTFDILFIVFADVAYRKGSILHTFNNSHFFIFVLTIMLTSILVLGLLHRERKGVGKMGWESLTILILFILGYIALFYIN